MSSTPTPTELTRDRMTWVAYLMTAFSLLVQFSAGPIMPLLRADLNLNFSQGGLHLSAFASGGILVGLTSSYLAPRLGRGTLLWGAGTALSGAIILLTAGRTMAVTLPAMFVLGISGAFLIVVTQSVLTDRHAGRSDTALTEQSTVGALGTVLSPLLIGGMQAAGLGWRAGMLAMIAVWVPVIFIGWGVKFPKAQIDTSEGANKLDGAIWAGLVLLFFSAAVEWCILAWSADFLIATTGMAPALASSLLTAYFIANVVGRLGVARLTLRYPAGALLIGILAVGMAGFLVFWLVPVPWVRIAGLLFAGIGVANFFPINMAVLMSRAAPHQLDLVSGRTALFAASAVLSMPSTMGFLADAFGIQAAFGMVPVIIIVMAIIAVVMQRVSRRKAAADAGQPAHK